jgi:hypothetical protein
MKVKNSNILQIGQLEVVYHRIVGGPQFMGTLMGLQRLEIFIIFQNEKITDIDESGLLFLIYSHVSKS